MAGDPRLKDTHNNPGGSSVRPIVVQFPTERYKVTSCHKYGGNVDLHSDEHRCDELSTQCIYLPEATHIPMTLASEDLNRQLSCIVIFNTALGTDRTSQELGGSAKTSYSCL